MPRAKLLSMAESFTIGDWRVEPERGCLVAASHEALEVRLEPKAMQVLQVLAERRGEVVAKQELVDAVWPSAFVGDQVLVNAIWELRRALGDDSKNPSYIQTIPRRGYRLAAAVVEATPPTSEQEIESEAIRDQKHASRGRAARALIGALIAIVGVFASMLAWREQGPEAAPEVRFEIRSEKPLAPLYLPALATSADGSKLVFVARVGEKSELRLRRLDRLEEVPLVGTDGGHAPFFSPDGRWLGFFAGGRLLKIALEEGSPPVSLAEAGVPRGGTWSADDRIYFARGSGGGLWSISAAGGEPEPVTRLAEGEWTHRWPQLLPDGETLIFVAGDRELSGFDQARIVALSLRTGERRELVRGGSFPRFAAGRLYWVNEGRVLAAALDMRRLTLDEPRAVLEGVSWYPINGAAQLALADESLAYIPGVNPCQPLRRLRFLSPVGAPPQDADPTAESPRLYYDPALAADGRRLAVAIAEAGNSDLWIYDLARRTRSRLTDSPGEDQGPIWHPDGRQIAFYSAQSGPFQMFLTDASGAGAPRQLWSSSSSQRPECFTPDGRRLIFSENHPETGFDLWTLDLEGAAVPEPLWVTPYDELHARLSPEGQWLAYVSNESGRREVYLRPSDPEDDRRWPLSAGGGDNPVWDSGGGALYYRTSQAIHRVEISASSRGDPEIGSPEQLLEWSFPSQLLEGDHRRSFDVAPDGSGFLVLEPLEEAPPPIHVVLNWRPN